MNELNLIEYVEKLRKKKLSENTIEAYERDIKRYLQFLNSRNESIQESDTITIMAYVQELQKSKMANSSIVRSIISIRGFYIFLMSKGLVEDDPTYKYEVPKIKRDIPKVLTVEEVDKLLNMPDLNSHKGIRDKAMLEVMYATGIKVTELLNLNIYSLNLKLGYIKCKGTKEKERIIPIGSYAVNCIEEYLKIRPELNINNLDYLFFNSQGNRLTRQGFWKIIKEYAKDAKIKKNINLYTLRHSFAVHLLQNGADIRIVQELLGHTSIAATQIYSSITKKSRIAEIYNKTHPRA